ncbi:MAG: hypothetical protein AAGC95_17080 [Pseudomonadota bacterium]
MRSIITKFAGLLGAAFMIASPVAAKDLSQRTVIIFAPHKSDAAVATQIRILDEAAPQLAALDVDRMIVYVREQQTYLNEVRVGGYDIDALRSAYGPGNGGFLVAFLTPGEAEPAVSLTKPVSGWCFVRLVTLLDDGDDDPLGNFDICAAYGEGVVPQDEDEKKQKDEDAEEDD